MNDRSVLSLLWLLVVGLMETHLSVFPCSIITFIRFILMGGILYSRTSKLQYHCFTQPTLS